MALARSLVKHPKLLLLDEPLGALDRKLREHTQFELVNIQERIGITFVMVTHDQEEAMTMSTRMAVMNEGRIRQIGTPSEIVRISRPIVSSPAFIGAVNQFEGRALQQTGDLLQVHRERHRELRVRSQQAVAPGSPVVVAVRPEKVRIGVDTPPPGDNQLQGRVEEIAYLGDVSVYHIRVAGGALIEAQLTNRARRAAAPLTWGDQAWVGLGCGRCPRTPGIRAGAGIVGLRSRLTPGRNAVAGSPLLWLALFFGLPFLIILRISLSEAVIGLPPYSGTAGVGRGRLLQFRLNLANFLLLVGGHPVSRRLRQLGARRRDLDAAVPADRLSDGARHHPRA